MNELFYDLSDNCDRISFIQDKEYFECYQIKYNVKYFENSNIVSIKFYL